MSGVKKKAKARRKAHKFYLDKRTMLRMEIIAGIVLFVYLAGSIFFGSHFYIRSRVNGVGASFRTAESAYEKILSNAVIKKHLTGVQIR